MKTQAKNKKVTTKYNVTASQKIIPTRMQLLSSQFLNQVSLSFQPIEKIQKTQSPCFLKTNRKLYKLFATYFQKKLKMPMQKGLFHEPSLVEQPTFVFHHCFFSPTLQQINNNKVFTKKPKSNFFKSQSSTSPSS